jgi:hypothetical protein
MSLDGQPTSGRMAAAVAISIIGAGVSLAPPAAADSVDSLRSAVMQSRGSSCGGLRSEPLVEQAALNVNQSVQQWLNNAARSQPVPDAVPLLKDLGYGGTKATMIFGAGRTDAAAIKGLLLEGYDKVPDCTYTDFGASAITDQTSGRILMAVVLAGA